MIYGSASVSMCSLAIALTRVCLQLLLSFKLQVEELAHCAYQSLSDGDIAAFPSRLTFHFLSCGAED